MSERNEAAKPKWYSIKDAADYLDVGEPTIYRWMREGRITFRKVGDSTRFWREDLDAMMQVFRSASDAAQVQAVCPFCNGDDLVEGTVQSTGLTYFRPKKTKFWTFQLANVDTTAKMCARCGAVAWFGDVAKLNELRAAAGDGDQPEEAGPSSIEDGAK